MSKIFYIADTHFGHANIIRYNNAPFRSVEEMDRVLINNWNSVVTDEDTVYILGDFSWYKEHGTIVILDQLKGNKILLKGNHDRISQDVRKRLKGVYDYLEVNDNGTKVILSHYPMPFWNGQFRNTVHLYGHVHNSHQWNILENWKKELQQLQDLPMRMYNVGAMMKYMNYTPRILDEIIEGATNG